MGKSIAVAGKGGIGKSTLSALLVKLLQELQEVPILAVDADADSNLATLLGINDAESVGELREDVLQEIKNFPAGMSKAAYVEAGLHQIIVESNGFDLITMGRGEGAGCYCYLNSLIRKFSEDLAPSYKWVIFDNEAGLEHLSRRTTQDVDALLVVVNENPLSLHSAKNIKEIVDQMGNRIRSVYAVTNMVKAKNSDKIENKLDELGLEILSRLPYDETLEQMVFDNSCIVSIEGLAVREHVMDIIERVRRM